MTRATRILPFSQYDNQLVARAGWLPMVADTIGTLLHLAMNLQAGDPDKDSLRLRSKPEAFSPYYIDTGQFHATYAIESRIRRIYYRPGQRRAGRRVFTG